GHFRESLPGLQATLDHFGKSPFADDAAWCLAFAHYLLGESDQAFAGLDRYARLPVTDMSSDERAGRIAYWRARLHEKLHHKAEAGYQELVRRAPLNYYGLLAAARLKAAGTPVKIDLPDRKVVLEAPRDPTRDAAVARATDLLDAGMDAEAADEIARAEKEVL